jgi:hypothetical protein
MKMDEKVRKKKRERKMHVKEIMHGTMGESMGGRGPVIITPKKKKKKKEKRFIKKKKLNLCFF